MASLFGHGLVGIAIGKGWLKTSTTKVILLCVLCSIIPDADVIGFWFGVAYESPFGHRGFTHSLLFAFLFSISIILLFFCDNKNKLSYKNSHFILFFLCTISHGILDAMTTGGLGVNFFFPFNNERYFFSFRPINVSPLGVSQFFSEWGWRVIKSEIFWIGIPSFVIVFIRIGLNRIKK